MWMFKLSLTSGIGLEVAPKLGTRRGIPKEANLERLRHSVLIVEKRVPAF